jgi:signal recognition particle subunit SRP19
MRRKDLLIFWPQYFDKNRAVRLGRKVSKSIATPDPTLQDLLDAAKKAGYRAELDPEPKFPASWWDDPGRILLEGKGQKKTFILRKLAPEIQAASKNRIDMAKLEEVRKKYKKKQNVDTLKKKIVEKTRKQN